MAYSQYRNGYSPVSQRHQYDQAVEKYPNNKWAIKNHLKKHYGYDEDDAWEIYELFSGNDRGTDQKDSPVTYIPNNYIVSDVSGKFMLFGDEAKTFVEHAQTLSIPRHIYRVFVEVQV
jgi:hypothetical protein